MPEPHTFFEVTTRTIQGRFLLRPSKELNSRINGIIGRALTHYPVKLYLYAALSNHMHLILSAPDTHTLSAFMAYINSNIAREAGRLYRWKDKFWGRRYSAIPILDDASLMQRVKYLLSQGCKEGLVLRPGDWPGVHCVGALAYGHRLLGQWIDRTLQYEAGIRDCGDLKKFSKTYEVCLSPLPVFEGMSRKDAQARWKSILVEVEVEVNEKRSSEAMPVPSRDKILSLDPHDSPQQSSHSPRPFCHAAEKAAIKLFRESYEMFVEVYRLAQSLLTKGDPCALAMFPADCYIPPLALRWAQSYSSFG